MIATAMFAAVIGAASSTGVTGPLTNMGPDLQQMVLAALLNPAAILAGFFIGRNANQVQKVIVGGFAAGFAGLAFILLLDKLGVYIGNNKSIGGIFVASFLVGMVWCWIGFKTRKKPD